MNDWPRHSFRLNIRSASLSPIRKKQPTSSMGVKKQAITANKERNKRRKVSGAKSKEDNKKNMQNSSQHQVRQMQFLLQMMNRNRKWHQRQILCKNLILSIKKEIKEGKVLVLKERKIIRKNLQNPSQNQVRQMIFFPDGKYIVP